MRNPDLYAMMALSRSRGHLTSATSRKEATMTTFRIIRRNRFTTVDQQTVNDPRLSYRALGILVWLLDKPDDWTCRSNAIAEDRPEGRDAVRAALNELVDAGYLVRVKRQDEQGHWITTTLVYERPQLVDNPPTEAGFPGVGQPEPGQPGPSSKTETKDLHQPPLPPDGFKIPEWIVEEAVKKIIEHREAHGYGKAGPGAWRAAAAAIDRRLLAQWFNDGHSEHEIVRCLASRVIEPENHASPTVYFEPPTREPEPTSERVKELLAGGTVRT